MDMAGELSSNVLGEETMEDVEFDLATLDRDIFRQRA